VRRRDFVTILAAAAVFPSTIYAQDESNKLRQIGYLGSGTAVSFLQNAFREGLRELGWNEGANIAIDYRYAEGNDDRLPRLAAELVRRKVDVIVASPTPAALAARDTTQTIPIVGIGFDNPVEHGLITSLARPGGNVTGLSYSVGPEIFGKDLELMRELIPELGSVAVLSNAESPNHRLMLDNIKAAASSLSVRLLILDARGPEQFDAAFSAMVKDRVTALFVFGDPMFGVHRARLAELAAHNKLPSMYTNRLHVEAGGLMSYGPSFPDLWRRAAIYVDKLLRGAKPADLPVEQPTKFELVINLRTAKTLSLTVPPNLLARADEVIE
jgi:putative tryptophan/tyrosine transport system substrate-binding protein